MLAPCPSRTPDDLKPRWMGHFCGLCLELRDDAGQFARLTTNYDALALSVLVEAQQGGDADSRNAGPCALRGMRRQRIATGGGPRLAATASLVLASAKIRDHVEDGDGLAAKPGARGIAGLTADRLRAKAYAIGDSIELDTAALFALIEGQREIEAASGPGTPLTAVTAPTEAATAELFAHAALIGGRPENAGAFRTAGAAFGRLAHLLDAADDFEEDAERGAWNPLAATGSGIEDARALARGALADMKRALDSAVIVDATMTELLLDRYARHAFSKTFGSTCSTRQTAERRGSGYRERRDARRDRRSRYDDGYHGRRRGFWAGLCTFAALACSCQLCCAEQYNDPWTGQPRSGCCRDCADCCDCCECCNCCQCCGDSDGDGGCCGGCDCSCD
ncbi:DUF5685 family protein [Glycomyces luteolus]|uniref:DUF5685 family protein n=1 Tax=Glycomyces luteolus TaxID=2670330 RepID=A0A9X3P9F6_9ACTN|nr:DUF5685 family protein [Glycomyces luteolus]MDA1360802.1 DUF5685 family protein [Glycomyces luteolus]